MTDNYHSDIEFVCKTHLRFVPCRKDTADCILSSDSEIVEIVRKYQNSK